MKKILLFLSCIIAVQLEAISIKDKIANLRKALAVHAQSETKTWELLEELDKRLAHIETRISQSQISEAPCQPLPQALPQAQPRQEEQRTHTLNRLRSAYTPDPQQVNHSEAVQSPENQQNLSEKASYFQHKAAYFDSLLNTLRNHVENNAAVTTTPIPQASEHTIMQGSDSEPKQVMLKRRRNCRQKKLTHSADADRLSRAEKRRLRRLKRHADRQIVRCPATPSNRNRRHRRIHSIHLPREPRAPRIHHRLRRHTAYKTIPAHHELRRRIRRHRSRSHKVHTRQTLNANHLSRAEKKRLRRLKRHADKQIISCPTSTHKKHPRLRGHHSQLHANAINPNSVHHMNRSKKNRRRFKQHSMPVEEMQPVQPFVRRPLRSYPTHY